MSRQQLEDDYGSPVQRPGERLEHESRLGDPRSRERRRDLTAVELLGLGAVSGAGLFALGAWLLAMIADRHYSALVYIIAAAIGAAALAVILPYLSLARSDGADASIVRRRASGGADTPADGAEAADQGWAARRRHRSADTGRR